VDNLEWTICSGNSELDNSKPDNSDLAISDGTTRSAKLKTVISGKIMEWTVIVPGQFGACNSDRKFGDGQFSAG
jgi:hypothetical protein